MELLLVTGMSGSGKSRALNALEDIGYYCIDNLPPQFLLNFVDFMLQADRWKSGVAIIMDARSKEMFFAMNDMMDAMIERKIAFKTLFLDCDDQVLLNRYKESRRNHPLMNEHVLYLEDAIHDERAILLPIKNRSDFLIDTSLLATAQLKEKMVAMFSGSEEKSMHISFVSFGFKFGMMADADLVFDVRCMPNPYYVEELKEQTGENAAVRAYVMQWPQAQGLQKRIIEYLEYSIPLYIAEGKSQLVVAIGCTGGKHRSVTFAKLIGEYFQKQNMRVLISHRDISKNS